MSGLSVKVCFFAMVCTVVSVIIKQVRPDYAPFVRIASTVGIGAVAVSVAVPLITYLRSLFENGIGEDMTYVGCVVKALGVALLTQICADLCRDCGEASAASGVEMIGRIEILLMCLPLFETVVNTVSEVLAW